MMAGGGKSFPSLMADSKAGDHWYMDDSCLRFNISHGIPWVGEWVKVSVGVSLSSVLIRLELPDSLDLSGLCRKFQLIIQSVWLAQIIRIEQVYLKKTKHVLANGSYQHIHKLIGPNTLHDYYNQ